MERKRIKYWHKIKPEFHEEMMQHSIHELSKMYLVSRPTLSKILTTGEASYLSIRKIAKATDKYIHEIAEREEHWT